MPYINADTCLPPELIQELQKYVQGQLVYIPRPLQTRVAWGHRSGTREKLEERNRAIREAKAGGISINALADTYCLSPDAIRKVLYRRNPVEMPAKPA